MNYACRKRSMLKNEVGLTVKRTLVGSGQFYLSDILCKNRLKKGTANSVGSEEMGFRFLVMFQKIVKVKFVGKQIITIVMLVLVNEGTNSKVTVFIFSFDLPLIYFFASSLYQ